MDYTGLYNDFSGINKQMPRRAKGFGLVTYSIALEAWRRGLELKFYTGFVRNQARVYYRLKSEEREYTFKISFGGNMDREVRKIVNSKERAKEYLAKGDVPVPGGRSVSIENGYEEVYSVIESTGYPAVVKPINGRLGQGVHTDIRDQEELEAALDNLKELGYKDIMVENFIVGEDTRVYVTKGEVIAAYKREPANVIGDGKRTIKELIGVKNKIRQTNPHAKKNKLEITDTMESYLKETGFSFTSVPAKDEVVYLTDSTLHIDGCEVVDVTDELTPKIREIAVNAVKAIPGMELSGLDIMINKEKDEGYVLELNASPNIAGHLFPLIGEPRDVHKAFIDHFFPETKERDSGRFKDFVFDFDNINKILKSGVVTEVTVPPLPEDELNAKTFEISGNVSKLVPLIRRRAVGTKLGGEVVKEEKDLLVFKVAGASDDVDKFTEYILTKKNSKTSVKVSDDQNWEGIYQYYFKSLVDFEVTK